MRLRPPPAACRATRRLAQSFVDDETDHDQTARVRAHLRDCPVCGTDVDEWRWLKSQTGRLGMPVRPGALRRLSAVIDQLHRGDGNPA